MLNPSTVITTIWVITALIPAITLVKYNSLILGIVLALIIQTTAMTMYLKWLSKHSQPFVPTYLGLFIAIVSCLALGGLSIGYARHLKGYSIPDSLLWVLLGGCTTLLTQAFSIKFSDTVANK